ncbi:MAG TPA: CHAD domain-containing protein, partial [Nitrospiraceae bacterium]|nr:CHAD domain-containing protein [Nitrospiraceae bacterium]
MTIVKNAHADTRTFRAAAGFRMPDLTGTSLAPETFTVTYYDTMDHRLARHHIVLCRRVEGGDTRWELALYGHPLQPLMRCADRSLRPPSSFHDALYIHLHGHELTAMAKFRTHRMGTQVFDGDRLLATLMLDRVAQLDGRRVVRRFAELTLAPMETDESALNRIEGLLRAAGAIDGRECPTICEVIGLDRISQRPAVSPTAATVDHLKAYFATELETILTHDPGTRLGFDPEDLHQMRVASRRLRAALRAAKPMLVAEWADELQVDLSWLGDVLGTARDLDVLRENLNVDSATLDPPERHAFEKLTAPLEGERAEVRAVMIEALKSNRYLQLLDRLRSAADAPQVVGAGLSLRDVAAGE